MLHISKHNVNLIQTNVNISVIYKNSNKNDFAYNLKIKDERQLCYIGNSYLYYN